MYEIHSFNKKIFNTQKAHIFGIDDVFGGVASLGGSLLGGLVGGTDPAQLRYNQLQSIYQGVDPTIDPTFYDTSFLNLLQYSTPEEIKAMTVSDDPNIRAIAEKALNSIQDRAKGVIDAKETAAYDKARRSADIEARGQSESIQREMQSRGIGTSGMGLALEQIAAQTAADRASQQMMQQAADSAQIQQQANKDALTGAYQLRGQDIGLSKTNADIINEFNKYNSAVQQATKNANTELMNQQLQRQRETQDANVELLNKTKQQGVQNTLAKAQGMSGVTTQQANLDLANQAAKSGMVQGIFGGLGRIGGGIYNASTGTPTYPSASQDLDALYKETINPGVSINQYSKNRGYIG